MLLLPFLHSRLVDASRVQAAGKGYMERGIHPAGHNRWQSYFAPQAFEHLISNQIDHLHVPEPGLAECFLRSWRFFFMAWLGEMHVFDG